MLKHEIIPKLKQWAVHESKSEYDLAGVPGLPVCARQLLADIVNSGKEQSAPTPDEAPLELLSCVARLSALEVVKDNSGKWSLTPKGMQQLRHTMVLKDPKSLSAPRTEVPVMSMTLLELLDEMERQGWTCVRWTEPGHPDIEYTSGSATVWYIRTGTSRWYLLALIRASELFALGVASIPHLHDVAFYMRYFHAGVAVYPKGRSEDFMIIEDVGVEGVGGHLEDLA